MPYCSRCGVEVDESVDFCPLCRTPIQKPGEAGAIVPGAYPKASAPAANRNPEPQNVFLAWMIVTVILVTPFLVVLTLGIQFHGLRTWAGYSLCALAAAWVCITLLVLYSRRPVILSTGIAITIGAMLFVFDSINGRLLWFFPTGVPLLVLFFALLLGTILLCARLKQRGLNVGAIVIFAAGIMCLGLDLMLSRYFTAPFHLSWSLIVVSALFPLAVFLLILHYVLKKKIDYKRFFHI
jgi:hypothetical protein